MTRSLSIFILSISIFVIGCIPATQEPMTEVTLNVLDQEFQRVYDYQDRQEVDSLLQYTNHPDPSYRYLVASSMASIQSERSLDSLYKLMYDPVMKVRTAAAYAVGQIGSSRSETELLNAFKVKDTLDVSNRYNATIIEAIGKVGSANLLPALATVSTYRSTDTLLLTGQCRAIYSYALRGMTTPEGTDKMVQYLTEAKYPPHVKMLAANYLARAKDIDLSAVQFRLIQVLNESKDPNVRMAVALALGKTSDGEVFDAMISHLNDERDPRVKSNIIRSLSNFQYIKVVSQVLELIKDDNQDIASTAANYLLKKGNKTDAAIYRTYINDSLHYSVQAKMYAAVLEHMPVYYTNTKNKIKDDILAKIEATDDPYAKAAYVEALGHNPFNCEEIIKLTSDSKFPIVRSAGASAISNAMTSDNFVKAFRGGHLRKKVELIELLKPMFEKGDAGVLAVYGEMLSNESLGIKPIMDDLTFLESAKNKLKLPNQIETYNSLSKAIDFLTDKKYQPKTLDYNHPIDWSIFAQYGDSIAVAIKTNKGVIRTVMFASEAPGSVANFVTLAKDNFYDGKPVHRVVPNFVVQGGCPRGDGYGSLDYTIRSELPQLYYEEEGLLGMASAGLHTEGTQWFITHSPTMHLSGKYTIFGKVTDGMDIVQNIEVGDVIEDMVISKY